MSWFKKSQRYYDPDAPGEIDELPDEQNLPVVTPDNINDYIEPEEDEEAYTSPWGDMPPQEPEIEETFLDEMPEVYEDDQSIIEEAIDDQQCILFEYTTRKNRYAGVRIVEPVAVWTTINTHNRLCVGWDRTRDGIRAFLVDNIHPGTLKTLGGQFYSFEPKFIFNPQY